MSVLSKAKVDCFGSFPKVVVLVSCLENKSMSAWVQPNQWQGVKRGICLHPLFGLLSYPAFSDYPPIIFHEFTMWPFFYLKAFPKIPFVFGHVGKWRWEDRKKTDGKTLFTNPISSPPNNGNSSNLMMSSKKYLELGMNSKNSRSIPKKGVWLSPNGLGWLLEEDWCRRRRRGGGWRLTYSVALSRHEGSRQFGHFVPKHGRACLNT